jgi:hypothetical protein
VEVTTIREESMQIEKQTLTIVEAAKVLGVGRNKAYEAAHRGELSGPGIAAMSQHAITSSSSTHLSVLLPVVT